MMNLMNVIVFSFSSYPFSCLFCLSYASSYHRLRNGLIIKDRCQGHPLVLVDIIQAASFQVEDIVPVASYQAVDIDLEDISLEASNLKDISLVASYLEVAFSLVASYLAAFSLVEDIAPVAFVEDIDQVASDPGDISLVAFNLMEGILEDLKEGNLVTFLCIN